MKKNAFAIFLLCASLATSRAQNPFFPLWEHIPDGEPYVFDDPDRPGHQRVYIYGSHDERRTDYCGLDQVVWSAPVEDLSQWRLDGTIFTSITARDGSLLNEDGRGDVLFAPDVVEIVENGKKVYYLTPNNQSWGRTSMIAKADRPDGPFHVCNWAADGRTTEGVFQFDPAIFSDDDGRVYGYWGFQRSYAAEIDPQTMCTVKPGTHIIEDMVSSHNDPGVFRFFEASSMRKILGKYVFIYSRFTEEGEFQLPTTNYTLAYAYSDHPLGPWTYGGTLIDGRARGTDQQGNPIPTANVGGNTHGSLLEINGQWWLFYHRQSGTTEYTRQAMVAPVQVRLEGDKLLISEAEYTSEGFLTQGLDPLQRQQAGYACYYTGPTPMGKEYPNYIFSGSYVAATYLDNTPSTHYAPVVNNTAGSTIGYKYINFDQLSNQKNIQLCLTLQPLGVKGEILIMIDSPWTSRGGRQIGRITLDGTSSPERTLTTKIKNLKGVTGKHPLYMKFVSPTPQQSLCTLYDFVFTTK